MTRSPQFTVDVPLYNKAAYVGRAFASIRAQTLTDFEVIVIDDGSTDDGLAIATELVRDDPRFRLIRQANGGVSRARNAAIALAGADWLAFLDADDEWLPGYLQAQAAARDAFAGAALISTDYIDRTGTVDSLVDRGFDTGAAQIGDYDFFAAWEHAGTCPAWICATVIRRDALLAAGGFAAGVQLGEDLLAFIAVIRCGRVVFVNQRLAIYYRDSTDSLARAPSVAAVLSHGRLLAQLDRLCAQGVCPPSVRNRYRDIHVHHLIRASMRGDLWRFMMDTPGYWHPRIWALAALELTGLRAPLKSLLRPDKG